MAPLMIALVAGVAAAATFVVGPVLAQQAAHQASQPDSGDATTPTAKPAQDTTPTITFGGYVDGYYAWDGNRPYNFDRAYTTQPARHAEFNVNLAFVDARITGPRYRGRVALQFGTSVQSNYAGEPAVGRVSGPSVSQYIQEATIGYQLSHTVWVDGGIFFAHTGYEGFISRDNLAYTRSLVADYSPYYEAGVKVTWQPSASVTAQLDLVNGWQDISKYNTPPAAGIRIDYALDKKFAISYDNFVGNVAADTAAPQVRFYNDLIAQYNPTDAWQLAVVFDVGTQGNTTAAGGTATWYGTSIIAKHRLTSRVALVGRVERFADPDQAIVKTGLPAAFVTNGASIGGDVTLVPRVLWRTELRRYRSSHAVWPRHRAGDYSRGDSFVVTSLALTL